MPVVPRKEPMAKLEDDKAYSKREYSLMRIFCGAVTVIGLLFALHGGLSLIGGFGLERTLDRRYGRSVQTRRQMWVELFAGGAACFAGLAGYYAAKRHEREKPIKESQKKQQDKEQKE